MSPRADVGGVDRRAHPVGTPQPTRAALASGRSGSMHLVEGGMAELFCSETAMGIALDAIRVHGGYGYSTEFDVERYFRDAPLMIVGEGTNEIQSGVIARQLVTRGALP